tara:strand:+ start:13654 stop:14493 length:840 start_codon:yes stop_codon:yes gene_type:complete
MSIGKEEFNLLRSYVLKHCGVQVGDQTTYLIESRLIQLAKENNCQDLNAFYLKAVADTSGELRDKILNAMTTNETSWFRDPKLWEAIEEDIAPRFIKKIQSGEVSTIRTWSTSCSTGQEVYSYQMLLDHILYTKDLTETISLSQFESLGTDISPKVLYFAIAGKYDRLAMARGLSPLYKEYFTEEKGNFTIDQKIRESVKFKKFNLQKDFSSLGKFDLIFCRNVTAYFSEAVKKNLFDRIAKALNPNGILIVGPTETPSDYCNFFTPNSNETPIYYQLK